jgi:hypothetical protein
VARALPKLPEIPEEERTPLVVFLLDVIARQLEIITRQQEQIQELKDEIARLKKHKPKHKIRPSSLEKVGESKEEDGKRTGAAALGSARARAEGIDKVRTSGRSSGLLSAR